MDQHNVAKPENEGFLQVLLTWVEISNRRSIQYFARWMSVCGLTKSQIGALMRLYLHGQCPVSEIGEDLGITTAAASQLVDRLVQMDLLGRVEDPIDRRIKRVSLSQEGERVVRQGVEARVGWLEGLAAAIAPQEKADIQQSLASLISASLAIEKENA